MFGKRLLILIFCSAVFFASARFLHGQSAGFTPGNLVIYRVGNGTTALSNTGSPVFLDEYTQNGIFVRSLAMPTEISGNNRRLIATGTSVGEGFLTLSADGKKLIVPGYDVALGGSTILSSSNSMQINRVVGVVGANGETDTTTALNNAFDGGQLRGVCSSDGNSIWLAGGIDGVRYATRGSNTSSIISSTTTNLRSCRAVGGQLYAVTASGTAPFRIGLVGTGFPVTGGQTTVPLAGYPVAGIPLSFVFADLSNTVAGDDTLYVTDDGVGSINKFSLVGTNWVANGSIAAASVRGLVGINTNAGFALFGTTGSSTGGGLLYKFTDVSGYNGAVSGSAAIIATSPTNTAFRGIAFAPATGRKTPLDFDGDGKSDYAVIRSASETAQSVWYINRSSAGAGGANWGTGVGLNNGDRPTPADFDGDGKTDIAVWRRGAPTSAAFFILQSATGTVRIEPFGQTGDDPSVVGDYDGDGKADVAVFRPNPVQSFFYYRGSLNNPNRNVTYLPWGQGTDVAAPGDFDGDGKFDVSIKRNQAGNTVFIRRTGSDNNVEFIFFGLAGDKFVPGDYDGDGKTDIALVRSQSGLAVWHFRQSSNGNIRQQQFGLSTDSPAQGDYDGDGKTDIGIWRASGNLAGSNFYVLNSASSVTEILNWGIVGDYPLAAFNNF